MTTTPKHLLAILAAMTCCQMASAQTVVVNQFTNQPVTPLVDQWYYTDVRPGASASIQSAPAGGPLPTGAALLTTNNSDTNAKAEVGTFANYGLASTVLSAVQLSYSYYKTASTEQFAAPSLKLTIYNPSGTGSGDNDSFGQLVYEPNWNQGTGGSSAVPTNSWQSVSINSATGSGGDATGGWFWSGGFGFGNGAGGPPLRSLAEWLTAFQTGTDAADFAGASVTGLSVGIGTFNLDQIADYFDAVHIQTGSIDKTYDFEPGSVPDSGTTVALLGLALVGMVGFRRRSATA